LALTSGIAEIRNASKSDDSNWNWQVNSLTLHRNLPGASRESLSLGGIAQVIFETFEHSKSFHIVHRSLQPSSRICGWMSAYLRRAWGRRGDAGRGDSPEYRERADADILRLEALGYIQ